MSKFKKNTTNGRWHRRSFTDEFKAGTVRLVLDESKSIAAVARDLDLTPSSLRSWSSLNGLTAVKIDRAR